MRARRRQPPAADPDGEQAAIAGARQLRRIELLAAAYTAVAAVAYLARRGLGGAVVLTLLGVASIVGFRSLQGLVARLVGAADTATGWRVVAPPLLRLLMVGAATAIAFSLSSDHSLAI